jgi:phospholipase/lecithinase/hemolysin
VKPPRRPALVVFGDSLSDEGTFGFRFTTRPGHTWTHHVAATLGRSAEPAMLFNYADAFLGRGRTGSAGGGTNFAQGGARVALPYSSVSEEPWGIPWSVARQLDVYLARHPGFGSDDLVAVFAGTNDVTYRFDPSIDPALAAQLRQDVRASPKTLAADLRRMKRAASDLAVLVTRMRRAGAPTVLVLGLYDLAAAPWFRTTAARVYVDTLTRAYDTNLRRELDDEADTGVQFVDTRSMFAPILADPVAFGLSCGRGVDACAETGADALDFCDVATQRSPTSHRDCVFAASLHLSTASHELLAKHVISQYLRKATVGIEPTDGKELLP